MDIGLLFLPPYRMVLINIIVSFILVIFITIYFLIFKKNKIPYLTLLILISFLPLISIFRKGPYESGDMIIHIIRTIPFFNSLKEGILIPVWAENLNATYGYPLFLFEYPLPYLISAFYHLLGFSFINSIKLLLITAYVGSGITMFYWLKSEFSRKAAFVGAIFYLFAPYHLVVMHFRSSVGELTALVFLPLSLLFIKKFAQNYSITNLVLSSISMSLLILSHQVVSLIGIPFIFIYSLLYTKLKRPINLIRILLPFVLTLLLTAYYWLPILIEKKFTHQALYSQYVSYQSIKEFIYSPWKYGFLFQGHTGELSFIIGYVQWIVIISLLILLIRNKISRQKRNLSIFLLTSFIFFLFMMLKESKFIWNLLPILKNMLISYRILNIVILITSVSAALLISTVKYKRLFYAIIFLAIFQTILNWGNRGTLKFLDDEYLTKSLPYSTYEHEGLNPATPKWVDPYMPWQKVIPQKHLEVIEGEANITEVVRKSTYHSYTVVAKNTSILKENTYYFPGWILKVNNQQTKVEYTNSFYPGIMMFKLNPGNYKVEFIFKETPIRKVAIFISSISFCILGVLLITKSKKSLKFRKFS